VTEGPNGLKFRF